MDERIHEFADAWREGDGPITEAYRQSRVKLTYQNQDDSSATIPILVSEFLGSNYPMRFRSRVVSELVWVVGVEFSPGVGAGDTLEQSVHDLLDKITQSIQPGQNVFNKDTKAVLNW